jgi:hypothetical protein
MIALCITAFFAAWLWVSHQFPETMNQVHLVLRLLAVGRVMRWPQSCRVISYPSPAGYSAQWLTQQYPVQALGGDLRMVPPLWS